MQSKNVINDFLAKLFKNASKFSIMSKKHTFSMTQFDGVVHIYVLNFKNQYPMNQFFTGKIRRRT